MNMATHANNTIFNTIAAYIINIVNIFYQIINLNNLSKIKLDKTCNIYMIKSGMGTGKTNAIFSIILDYKPKTLVFLSSRQSFTDFIKGKFPSIKDYRTVKKFNNLIDLKETPYIIVQLESLHKLSTDIKPDLLILDESESVLEQFKNPSIRKNGSLFENYTKFEWICKYSKYLIVSDAYLGERSIEIIKRIRTDNGRIKIIINEYNSQSDINYNIMQEHESRYRILEDMKNNKNIVITTNSKDYAKGIYEMIMSEFPKKIVKMYNGDPNETDKIELKDVNKNWSNTNVLIYTSTITTGISFEKNWFNVGYGYFTNYSCNYIQCIQMLGRVRNLKNWNLVIELSESTTLPENIETLEEYIENNWNKLCNKEVLKNVGKYLITEIKSNNTRKILHKDTYYYIYMYNLLEDIKNSNNFKYRLINLLKIYGANVKEINSHFDIKTLNILKSIKAMSKYTVKINDAYLIYKAENYSASQKENISNKCVLSKNEHLASEKYTLAQTFNLDPQKITKEFALDHANYKIIKRKKLRNEIESGINLWESFTSLYEKTSYYVEKIHKYDNSVYQLNFNNNILMHKIAIEALFHLGCDIYSFKSALDSPPISIEIIQQKLSNFSTFINFYREDLIRLFNKSNVDYENSHKWTFKQRISFLNSIIFSVYGLRLLKYNNSINYKFQCRLSRNLSTKLNKLQVFENRLIENNINLYDEYSGKFKNKDFEKRSIEENIKPLPNNFVPYSVENGKKIYFK